MAKDRDDALSQRNDGERDVAKNPVPGPATPGAPPVGPTPEQAAQEAENLKSEQANAVRNAAIATGATFPDAVEEVHRAAPDAVPASAPSTAAPSAAPPHTGRAGGARKV